MQSYFIDVHGIRTRYLAAGSGKRPVVFVHGGTIGDAGSASSADDFLPLAEACGETRQAISVDRLGHSLTDNPADNDLAGWTMSGSVSHFIRFLEELGAAPYHLVGQSRGGYLVTRTTLERPDLVAVAMGTDVDQPRMWHIPLFYYPVCEQLQV